MHEAIALSEEIHEGAEIDDLHHLALVDLAFLGLCHDLVDHVIGLLDRFLIGRGDLDDAVIIDIDLGTRNLDDLADHLAARTDHLADLVRRDLHGFDTRRVLREIARAADRLVHFAEDVLARILRLRKRRLHDLGGDPGHLDIHLEAGDPVFGACHLEIHVAEVILIAQDIREHGEFLALEDEAHGNAGNRLLQRHARIHHRKR